MTTIDRFSRKGRILGLGMALVLLVSSLAAADDHGGTCAEATEPEPYGSCFSAEATFETLNDIDVFKFTAPYTATYNLFTTGSADPHLNVRDANCANTGLYDSGSGSGNNASLQLAATAGQIFYLEVHNEGNSGDVYKVHLTGCKGGCASDQQEDQIWNATQLQIGTSVAGTIECSKDIDVLQVWPQEAGKHWIHVYPDTATGLETQLYSGHDSIWGTDNTASEFHFAYNMQPGPYYLQFYVNNALFNPPPSSEFRYQVQACTADEFNDEQGQASYIPSCGAVDRGIDCSNDVDWYRFTASSSAIYDFTVTSGADLAFGLFDSNGGAHDTAGPGTLSRSVSAGESIWIEVWGVSEATGAYNLEISGCGASGCGDDPGNNNQAASTVLLGCVENFEAGIECDGDWDWYKLTAPNAGTYTFTVTPAPGFTTYIGLYDAAGDRVTGGADSASITVGNTVEMFARVEAYDAGETFDYDLTINGCSTCGDDPGDDNLGDFTNINGCGTTTAAIDCAGDLDYYGFVAATPGSYTFATTGSLDTELRFYDANGDVITTDDNSGTGNNASITWTLTNGVRYYVAVNEKGYDDTGSYALEISGCSGGGDCQADQHGDTIGDASSLSGCGTTPAAIDCAGDVDMFRFIPTVAATYTFETTGSTDTVMTLRDSSGDLIDENDDQSGDNRNARVVEDLLPGVTYYIELNHFSNDATGDYDLVVSGCGGGGCGSDPGNNNQAASTVLLGCVEDFAAGIDCDGDWDWYKLTAPNAGTFTFTVAPAAGFTSYIGLYDASGDRITGGADTATITVGNAEEMFARVEAFDGGDTFAYDLTITGCSTCGDDPGDDNLADFTNINGCGTTTAAIDCAGDLDYYGFVAATPGSYTFATTGSLDTELRFYDANGDVITTDDNSGTGNNASITWTLTNGVRYYVAVNEKGYDDTGSYNLEISGCSGGGDCPADQHGDTIGDASSLSGCGTTPAGIECAGDVDVFRFIPTVAATYTFETTGSTDTVMTLRDSGGDQIDTNDDQSGDNRNARIEYDLLPGVTYYIEINEYSNVGTGDYDLVVSGCDGGGCGSDPGNDTLGTATELPGCVSSHAAAIDCAGDWDWYKITAPNAGNFVVAVAPAGGKTSYVGIFDAAGSRINGGVDSASVTATSGQEIFARIEANTAGETFSYTLTITGCSGGGCPDDQHGDTIGDASSLPGCGTTPAEFDCVGDTDMFSFIPVEAGTYTFETTGSTDTKMTLRDSGGVEIDSNDDQSGENRNAKIVADLLPGLTYYIELIEFNEDETGAYDLVVSGCGGSGGCDDDPDNDTPADATPLSSCGSWDAGIDCASDADFYRFTAPSQGSFTFSVAAGSATVVTLYDSNENFLAQHESTLSYTFNAGEAAFVRVIAEQPSDLFDYTLSVAGCGGGGCPGDPGNDDRATASLLNGCGTTSAAFDCEGDIDYYRFSPSSTAMYTFETTGSLDTMMELQAADGSQIAANDDQSSTDRNARIEHQLTDGETYYLKVNAYSADVTGSYNLVVSGCGGSPSDPMSWVVTATAKLAGAAGTNWASDLALFNHGTSQAQVTVSLWKRDQANLNPQLQTLTINPGELRKETDVLGRWFGITSGAAALHVSSNQPLVVASRTYNDTGAGTYGQFIPGEKTDDAFDASFPVYVMGMVETSSYRTNLGLVNPTSSAIQVIANFSDSDGVFLANRTYTVPAQSTIQVNRILNTIGASGNNHAWAALQVNSGEFFAYISVVDNTSGDPVYRPALLAPSAPMNAVLDGAATIAGAAGTNWVTDAAFFNASVADQNVTLRLWRRDANNATPLERSFTVRPTQVYGIADVLGQLFGQSQTAGSIEVVSGANLIADARTYNLVATGTYGQYIPARGADDAIAAGVGYLCMTSQSAIARTNLGLTNLDDQPADVEVRLFDSNGNQVGGTQIYTVRAHGTTQVNRVVEEFTGQDLATARLEISVGAATPNGLILAFGSVVDEQTGDPVFEAATVVE